MRPRVPWKFETGPNNTLMPAGSRKSEFVHGTEIIVKGFLAKAGDRLPAGVFARDDALGNTGLGYRGHKTRV
jgi:hypothetical protein